MSSIKFESNTNTDEVLSMTMQWGYKASSASRRSEPARVENEKLSVVFRALKPVMNFFSMLAGAATAFAILAGIAWMTGMLPVLMELYQAASQARG